MKTKRYDIADVVSVTTGRLVTPRHVDAMYDILNWMTNDNLFTHQLPRASQECAPWLLRWFPELAKAQDAIPLLDADLERLAPKEACRPWVGKLALMGLPQSYDVPRIPQDDHEQIDAYDELVQMRGSDEGIIIANVEGNT